MTEIYIKGPAIVHVDSETTVEAPSAPPRPVRKPPTDNGGRPISKDGRDLPATPAAKRDSGPKTRWRVWSEERPEEGEHIFVCFKLFGIFRGHIACLDGQILLDDSCRSLFSSDLWDPSETLYQHPMPDDIKWIPLAELLKGVEV